MERIAMELLIILLMIACCVILVRNGDRSISLLFGVLSVNVIASFVVVMATAGSRLAVLLFAANLLVSPWVAFSRLKEEGGERQR